MKTYLKRNLIAIDQLVNTSFGGNPDETISSRLGRYARRHDRKFPFYLGWLYSTLEAIDYGHCDRSIEVIDERH